MHRLIRRTLILLPFVLIPLVAAGCDEPSTTAPGLDASAHLSLLLTDAPADLEEAVVTIRDIYLQGGDAGGRVYLRQDDPVTTDLLTLANDVVEIVDDYEVPAGAYSQLRFVIDGAYLRVHRRPGEPTIYATSDDYEGLPPGVRPDGRLICPSCAQSGFKVLLAPERGSWHDDDDLGQIGDAELYLEGDETILVDFDVSRSFGHAAGNSGQWIMRPTLRATRLVEAATLVVTLSLDPTLAALLGGEDAPDLSGMRVALAPANGGDPKFAYFGAPDGDGRLEARFGYLFPGDYSLSLDGVAGAELLADLALPLAIAISRGEDVGVDLTLREIRPLLD